MPKRKSEHLSLVYLLIMLTLKQAIVFPVL